MPPKSPAVPEVEDKAWPKNTIDYFVLHKQEQKGFKPNPEADKERLLKRLCFDLNGLPPDIALMDKFLADKSPNAYEKMVDELMARPQYGEKMALHWMDIARYADSHGYQDDNYRTQWPWRDWVIHAYNENLPYKDFITWQLAGDLMPNHTKEQLLATGFNRNHKITEEGGVIDEEYRDKLCYRPHQYFWQGHAWALHWNAPIATIINSTLFRKRNITRYFRFLIA